MSPTGAPASRPRFTFFLPFAALGAMGLAFLIGGSLTGDPGVPAPMPLKTDGSVQFSAVLERAQLHAEQQQEVYARVKLTGGEAPLGKVAPPMHLILVLDTSGSMSGAKIKNARESAIKVLEQLRPNDRADIITFSSGARLLLQGISPGPRMQGAIRTLNSLTATGGTNMIAGLREVHSLARTPGTLARILLMSDGQPDSESGLRNQVRALARAGIPTTSIGIGRNYNEDLMAELADAGLGNYYFVEHPQQMPKIFAQELLGMNQVLAQGAKVILKPGLGVQILEVHGWKMQAQGNATLIEVGDIYAQRSADLLVRLSVDTRVAQENLILLAEGQWQILSTRSLSGLAQALTATFTSDATAVATSVRPDVAEKAEVVKTAEALELASAAYATGNAAQAQNILRSNKARVRSYAKKSNSAGAKKAARALFKELDSFEAEASAPMADKRVYQKKAKAKARSMRKH